MGSTRVALAGIVGAAIGIGAVLSVAAAAEPVAEVAPVGVVVELEPVEPAPLDRGGYTVEVIEPAPVEPVKSEPVDGPAERAPEPGATVAPVDPGECLDGGGMFMRGGTCEPVPGSWPFSTGDTLVCGTGAKPALDYREDVGWWAYCEPALVE